MLFQFQQSLEICNAQDILLMLMRVTIVALVQSMHNAQCIFWFLAHAPPQSAVSLQLQIASETTA